MKYVASWGNKRFIRWDGVGIPRDPEPRPSCGTDMFCLYWRDPRTKELLGWYCNAHSVQDSLLRLAAASFGWVAKERSRERRHVERVLAVLDGGAKDEVRWLMPDPIGVFDTSIQSILAEPVPWR